MNVPGNLLYTKEHEWAKVEGTIVTVGISDFAQNSLGDITFIELPEVGAQLQQSKRLGTVESVKAASDIYAPLSGKVTEVNDTIVSSPELVNQAPYEGGWFAKIALKDENETKSLMSADDYTKYVEGLS
ncbi:glycine cleavage system protein GcvH [Candidatus Omnitrophota bacterium]